MKWSSKETGRAERLAQEVRETRTRAVGQAMSWVLDERDEAAQLLALLKPDMGRAHRVGLTGPPGVGKSTLGAALARQLVERDLGVGMIAADPRSPFSGGAFLGDRVRLSGVRLDADKRVFFRSVATREASESALQRLYRAADVLDGAGYPWVFLETVGVGQADVGIREGVDTVVLVLSPDLGDEMQLLKAGILEIADIFVLNRAERDGAARVRDLIEDRVRFKKRDENEWTPPVVLTEALRGRGVDELLEKLEQHREWQRTGEA